MAHVSPSQIATFRDCPRKHAYSRVRPRTENKWAAFGSRAHTIAENWLEHGTPPDANTPEGVCILAGLGDLPMPRSPGSVVEHQFRETYLGATYTGRIDLVYGYRPGISVVICDHKTTGNLDYMMSLDPAHAGTDRDFTADPQRIVYSYWATQALGVESVTAHWQYYRRKPPLSRSIKMAEPAAEIEARFLRLHAAYSLPILAAVGHPPEHSARNLASCRKYGACPYRTECHHDVTPEQIAMAALTAHSTKEETRS